MRRSRLSFALSLMVVVSVAVACSDRPSPTAPFVSGQASVVVGTCTTFGDLQNLVTYVFGAGSPNVSSGLAKLNQVKQKLDQGDIPGAQEKARNLIAFVQEKANELQGRDKIQLLISSLECYVGITSDSFLIYPTDQPQTLRSESGKTGLQFDSEPVSEPTLVTIEELPDNTTGLLDTKLDKYPGFILLTQQSGVLNSLVKPVVVGVCPVGAPQSVLARLRLGHQRTTGFEITAPGDASFLDCSNVVGAANPGIKLPGWARSLVDLVMPKPLYAAVSSMMFAGGVGGTVTEFSPFGPVDPVLSFSGGVGGTVTEFIRVPADGGAVAPSRPSVKDRSGTRAPATEGTATVVGSRAVASLETASAVTDPCAEGIVGTAVATECRPRVTITTANGTILTGVPVTFAIGQGGGTTAIDDPTTRTCGTFGASASTITNVNGKAGACWILGATAGTNTLVATASAGGDAPAGVYFTPATSTFTVEATKATATITLSGLSQTYTGSPLAVTVTTTPAGLSTVNVTYDGSPTAPTNAGTYAVVATLDNPTWQGTASGSLVIGQASQSPLSVTGPSSAVYGAPAVQLATTGGSGTGAVTFSAGASTACAVTSNGSLTLTSGTGSCAVTATKASDTNYGAVTSDPLSITAVKATATIALGNLAQTYDGTSKSASASTTPSGLSVVTVTYDGGAALPVNAGSYAVLATLDNANYAATPASGTLVIAKANQVALSVTGPASVTFGAPTTQLGTSGGSGTGAVSFSAAGSTACSVSATGLLTVTTGTGTCAVTATKAGDTNYLSTTSSSFAVTVSKATASLSLSGLTATYDGTPKGATVTLTPSVPGLSVTYNGSGSAPTNAGSYAVLATLSNADYQASSASGTLVISKRGATAQAGSATIDFGDAVPSIPCSVTGLLSPDAGSVTCTTSVPPVNAAGLFTTSPVISPANPLNYAMTSVTGVLTVRGYIQTGCFSSPIYSVMPDTKSAQRKGSNLPVKCTLTTASGVPLTIQQGDLVVQDRGTDPNTAPNITGTTVFSGTNVFTASNSGNYSYGLNTGGAGFIAGHYYYVTATWKDGSKSQGWFLLK